VSAGAGARYERLVQGTDRAALTGIVAFWLFSLVWFWQWWLRPDHWESIPGMAITSAVVAINMFTPAYYLVAVWRASRPVGVGGGDPLRVAMIVTKAPSEPWDIVLRTIEAMQNQDWPHPYDCWLADEAPTDETKQWCAANDVQISTRFGIEEYHRPTWPRRTKSKEGNLCYFYDHWGYRDYDVVCQFDADHAPGPGYLAAVMPAYEDPKVGYVAAPSMCDTNADSCWMSRGRLFREASFHGVTQAGHNEGLAPYCIGSHYSVRTAALQEAGGVGPELAEDYTTSYLLNSHGWSGAFAIDAIAHGEGPETFADGMVQEMQWARSMGSVLFSVAPARWRHIAWGARWKLTYCLVWYWILAFQMLSGFVLTHWSLARGRPLVNVPILEFINHALLPGFATLALVMLARSQGLLRPSDAKVISWEGSLFHLARWPWAVIGLAQAVIGAVMRRTLNFRVTPKGASRPLPLPFRVILPYVVLSVVSSITLFTIPDPGRAGGYYVFAITNAFIYTIVGTVVVFVHRAENPGLDWRGMRLHGAALGVCATLAMVGTATRLAPLRAAANGAAFLPIGRRGAPLTVGEYALLPSSLVAVLSFGGLLAFGQLCRARAVSLAGPHAAVQGCGPGPMQRLWGSAGRLAARWRDVGEAVEGAVGAPLQPSMPLQLARADATGAAGARPTPGVAAGGSGRGRSAGRQASLPGREPRAAAAGSPRRREPRRLPRRELGYGL